MTRRSSRPQQRSVEAIEAIVDAARAAFGENGFAPTTLDEIAAACGRTKGAIYHHFESKEQLFEQVFLSEQRRIADAVVAAGTAADPVMSLRDGLDAYLTLVASDTAAARITLIDAPTVLGWAQWRRCDDGPFRTLLTASVERIADEGRFSASFDPAPLAELILGAVTEAALSISVSADSNPATYRRSFEQLLAGITLPQTT